MKLYSIAGTCAVSIHIVLEWIGQPFELILMKRGENRAPAYLAINPAGQVPALMLANGAMLNEAAAILPYLAECYPAARLDAGSDANARFQMARLMSYLTGELHVAFKPHFQPQRFLDDPAYHEALREKAWVVLDTMLQMLDASLAGKDHILAEHRTVADAYLYVLLRWVDEGPAGIASYPALSAYRDRMEQDSGVQRALAAHGMTALAKSD